MKRPESMFELDDIDSVLHVPPKEKRCINEKAVATYQQPV
jgi:hypothetical protein